MILRIIKPRHVGPDSVMIPVCVLCLMLNHAAKLRTVDVYDMPLLNWIF